ncbi:MAG: DUF3426 domain-containing protein [Pseudomonadota bacterium]
MIVQCEICQTKFKLDDERVPEEGAKARCSKCQHIFVIVKPIGTKDIEIKEKLKGGEKAVKSGNPVLKIMLVLALLVLICYGVFLHWDKLEEINWKGFSISYIKDYFDAIVSPNKGTILSKSQVHGYYMSNIHAGRILVVEGVVMNNSTETKGFIKVKVSLLDSMDKKLAEREAYCGNIFSRDELMELGIEEINSQMDNPKGESSVNMYIPPQNSIPFMVVFFNLPEGVKKFNVKLASGGKTVR